MGSPSVWAQPNEGERQGGGTTRGSDAVCRTKKEKEKKAGFWRRSRYLFSLLVEIKSNTFLGEQQPPLSQVCPNSPI